MSVGTDTLRRPKTLAMRKCRTYDKDVSNALSLPSEPSKKSAGRSTLSRFQRFEVLSGAHMPVTVRPPSALLHGEGGQGKTRLILRYLDIWKSASSEEMARKRNPRLEVVRPLAEVDREDEVRREYLQKLQRNLAAFSRRRIERSTHQLSEIAIGDSVYPLKESVEGTVTQTEDGSWEFRVDALDPKMIGHGTNDASAKHDWHEALHVAFQRLVCKQDWEMDDAEYATWETLTRVIDVEAYKMNTPISLRSIGRVSSIRPRGITWDNGLVEPVTLDKAPAEFATYDNDQWFEAELLRVPKTWELTRIIKVEKCQPMRDMTSEELTEFWANLTPTTELPVSTEVWGPRGDDVEDDDEDWRAP